MRSSPSLELRDLPRLPRGLPGHCLPGRGPLFSAGRCPCRDSVHCVRFISSQSHPKMVCLFGVSQVCLPEVGPQGPGSCSRDAAGSVPPAGRLSQLVPTSGPLHALFPPLGHLPPNLSHAGSFTPSHPSVTVIQPSTSKPAPQPHFLPCLLSPSIISSRFLI